MMSGSTGNICQVKKRRTTNFASILSLQHTWLTGNVSIGWGGAWRENCQMYSETSFWYFHKHNVSMRIFKLGFLAWKSNSARMTVLLPVTRGQLECSELQQRKWIHTSYQKVEMTWKASCEPCVSVIFGWKRLGVQWSTQIFPKWPDWAKQNFNSIWFKCCTWLNTYLFTKSTWVVM